MAKVFQKILISTIIFVLVFVSYGLPVKSIASEGKRLFSFSFFHKDEIELNAYFDEDLENVEKNLNVNDTARLTVEINPLIEGYLEEGSLELNLKNGNENNFKIKSVTTFKQEEEKTELFNSVMKLDTEETTDGKENVETDNFNESKKESVVKVENEVASNLGSSLFDTTKNIFLDSSVVSENQDSKDTQAEEKDTSNTVNEEKVEEVKEEQPKEKQEELNIEELLEVEESYEVKQRDENKVQLKNIIEDTKIFIDLEYKESEELNIEDLYSDIMITLEGNYINEDLESIEIFQEREIKLGWEYTKDVEVSANFTKVSPFTVGDNFGTIVESEIKVIRNVDSKSLPIKETNIKIEIPKINEKLPKEINVSASKMMATLGKESVSSNAMKNYCSYDEENGVLEIKVSNSKLVLGNGEDIFNISCRYEDYFEEEQITLDKNIQVKVEEYSAKENIIQEKNVKEKQDIEVKAGELISYFVSETEEKINKGKINANYYIENKYETEFSNVINLNILTSDVLDEILLQPSTDVYLDNAGNSYDANEDVKYKGVKFKTVEIQEMLEKGSTIDLLDGNGKVFHTISSENSATTITFSEKIDTLQIRINEIHTNGIIKVEFIKAIETSKYEPQQFKDITKISSTVDVHVKYAGFEERFSLPEVNIEKEFEDTITTVNFTMNKSQLSSMNENENVEFKIDLVNNLETSDIYKNPTFELAFPKYVKEVTFKSVNLLYQNGLTIGGHSVFNEDGKNKLRIELLGTQEGFYFADITNGTKVIINVDLVLDESTPLKKDEIELFYYNEAATRYQSQTNWVISKEIPTEMLNTVLGYDLTNFNYKVPEGMIAVNGISNFDSSGKTIKSIKQGEVSEKIEMNTSSKVATMTLTAINNTENVCSDMVLIGRVPVKDAVDIITNEEIGTTVDTKMVSYIEPVDTLSELKIYYSNNAKATNDLENPENDWKETPENLSDVKSYLIVIKDNVKQGDVLKFKYNFEIPEKLQFEAEIYGTFGVFYNKQTEVATIYEGVRADKVGLKTDTGPKIEATLEVDVGNGTEIEECRFLNYVLKITNTGSVKAENIVVKNAIPKYARLYEYTSDLGKGNNSYIPAPTSQDTIIYNIDKIEPGETKTFKHMLKAKEIPGIDEYYGHKILKDENGYYYEKYKEGIVAVEDGEEPKETEKTKEYVDPNYEIYIENKAIIEVGNLNINAESNVVKNKVKESLFDIEVTKNCMDSLNVGESNSYILVAKNISGKELKDVVLETTLPENVKPTEPTVILMKHGLGTNEFGDPISIPFDTRNITFDETSRKYQINFSEIYNEEILNVYLNFDVVKGDLEEKDVIFNFITNEKTEKSSEIKILYKGPNLQVDQTTNVIGNRVLEGETIEFLISIKNLGNGNAENIRIYDEIPECIDVQKIELSGDASDIFDVEKDNVLDVNINSLVAFGEVALKITGIIGDLEKDVELKNVASIFAKYNKDLVTNEIALIAEDIPEKSVEEKDDSNDDSNINNSNQNTTNKDDESNQKTNEENNESNNGQTNGSEINSENNNNQDNSNSNNNDKNNSNNNSENNSNNNDNNNSNNNNNSSDNNDNNSNVANEENEKKYKISGIVWLDKNKNGSKDDDEKTLSSIKVQLLKSGNVEKTIITNGNGKYEFSELSKGNYSIAFLYDENEYYSTIYKTTSDGTSSNAINETQGKAITNVLSISNSDIENVNLGLIKRESFDFTIKKEIVSTTLETAKRSETKTYEDVKLGKVEIKAKEIEDAVVELTYKITIKNTGDIPGYVDKIVDNLPKDTKLVDGKNSVWYMGNDGNAYYEGLKEQQIEPGEEKIINITIQKQVTEDNVGVLVNKASILKTTNKEGMTESKEGNDSTQEMIISISTGKVAQTIAIMIPIITLLIIAIVKRDSITYMIENKKKPKKIYR